MMFPIVSKFSSPILLLIVSCLLALARGKNATSLTKKEDVSLKDNGESNRTALDVLGTEGMAAIKGSWSLTVNDQCLYEFVYEFEHNPRFPIGQDNFKENCDFGDLNIRIDPKIAHDGIPFLQPRRFFERFPDYVWATIGFNHLSVDWLPCGRRPAGYETPQYDFSFFRVTPEYRAETMTCKLQDSKQVTIVPFEEFCDTEQEDINGMNMFVFPGSMTSEDLIVNTPTQFTDRKLSFSPLPHYGLRSWNEGAIPETPGDWDDIPIFMSTYAANLVLWQAHIPYKLIHGEERRFRSNADRYYHTTIQTLPDTWAVKYNELTGKVHFTIVGKSELCRDDFERAEKAAGGPPIFPNYDTFYKGSINTPEDSNQYGFQPKGSEDTEADGKDKSGSEHRTTWMGCGIFASTLMLLLASTTTHL